MRVRSRFLLVRWVCAKFSHRYRHRPEWVLGTAHRRPFLGRRPPCFSGAPPIVFFWGAAARVFPGAPPPVCGPWRSLASVQSKPSTPRPFLARPLLPGAVSVSVVLLRRPRVRAMAKFLAQPFFSTIQTQYAPPVSGPPPFTRRSLGIGCFTSPAARAGHG